MSYKIFHLDLSTFSILNIYLQAMGPLKPVSWPLKRWFLVTWFDSSRCKFSFYCSSCISGYYSLIDFLSVLPSFFNLLSLKWEQFISIKAQKLCTFTILPPFLSFQIMESTLFYFTLCCVRSSWMFLLSSKSCYTSPNISKACSLVTNLPKTRRRLFATSFLYL